LKVSPSLYSSKLTPKKTVRLIRNTISECVHVDVKDVENLDKVHRDVNTIRDNSDLFVDMHLIDESPNLKIDQLKDISPDYLAIQYENMKHPEVYFDLISELKDTSVGISITRATDTSEIEEFIQKSDYVLLMTTIPGESGGSFNDDSLEWIRSFREKYPKKRIHVDGGVDDLVSEKIRDLNIDCVVSGSYLMNAESMIASVLKLKGAPSRKRLTKHMLPIEHIPATSSESSLLEALRSIEAGQRGFCLVTEANKWGILTDGDIRRYLINATLFDSPLSHAIGPMTNYHPFSIDHKSSVENLLRKLIQEKLDKKLKFVVLTCYNEPIGILQLNKITRS
jgi:ribulose-phosphate 3-epimerase